MFKLSLSGFYGAGVLMFLIAIIVNFGIFWLLASAVVSGIKVGTDKCHQSWPADAIVASDWFCSTTRDKKEYICNTLFYIPFSLSFQSYMSPKTALRPC